MPQGGRSRRRRRRPSRAAHVRPARRDCTGGHLEFLGAQTLGDMTDEQKAIRDPLVLEQQPVCGTLGYRER